MIEKGLPVHHTPGSGLWCTGAARIWAERLFSDLGRRAQLPAPVVAAAVIASAILYVGHRLEKNTKDIATHIGSIDVNGVNTYEQGS